jgi:hypothetical protein
MTHKFFTFFIILGAVACLGACENAKKELGLTRSPPDEFAVVKRAPLEMPPDFSLRPPEPGTPRPQEQAMTEQAREAVLGAGKAQPQKPGRSKGEISLLDDAKARYNPDIRQLVDQEATKTERKNEPVVKKLLNIGKDQLPPATIVDPQAEASRLKTNAAEGKPVTAGKTPTKED